MDCHMIVTVTTIPTTKWGHLQLRDTPSQPASSSCNLPVSAPLNNLDKMEIKFNCIAALTTTLPCAALMFLLGGLVGCTATPESRFQSTQAAAETGDARSQYELARYYAKGTGVQKDYVKAVQYLRRSAEQGNAEAEAMLGSFYGRGLGVPRDVITAVQWYLKAAEQGNAVAQFAMGNFYANGIGMTNDMTAAIQWWQKAAGQNHTEAQAALGQLYLIADVIYGTNHLNYAEAIRWLRRAAAQNSADAMNNLGVAYENGFGVEMDCKKAASWYLAAAEQGDAFAQANLGHLYFDGRGVTPDLIQAYKWLKLSANQGNTIGKVCLADYQTYPLLNPKELGEAEQLVRDFRPRPAKSKP